MTLVITELSTVGIAMVADSAVTHFQNGAFNHLTYEQKLHSIPYLNAGISSWGIGRIDGISTNEWLRRFITQQASAIQTLNAFALELARHLNGHFPRNNSSESKLGFHLAGYEEFEGERFPSFYHIHNGDSQVLASRGVQVDPTQFNANHDMPPSVFRAQQNILRRRNSNLVFIYHTRNGDIGLYVEVFRRLGDFFENVSNFNVHVPGSPGLGCPSSATVGHGGGEK